MNRIDEHVRAVIRIRTLDRMTHNIEYSDEKIANEMFDKISKGIGEDVVYVSKYKNDGRSVINLRYVTSAEIFRVIQ